MSAPIVISLLFLLPLSPSFCFSLFKITCCSESSFQVCRIYTRLPVLPSVAHCATHHSSLIIHPSSSNIHHSAIVLHNSPFPEHVSPPQESGAPSPPRHLYANLCGYDCNLEVFTCGPAGASATGTPPRRATIIASSACPC